jgi:hypothetical protein
LGFKRAWTLLGEEMIIDRRIVRRNKTTGSSNIFFCQLSFLETRRWKLETRRRKSPPKARRYILLVIKNSWVVGRKNNGKRKIIRYKIKDLRLKNNDLSFSFILLNNTIKLLKSKLVFNTRD